MKTGSSERGALRKESQRHQVRPKNEDGRHFQVENRALSLQSASGDRFWNQIQRSILHRERTSGVGYCR